SQAREGGHELRAPAGACGGAERTEMLSQLQLALERAPVLFKLGRAGVQQIHADHVHRSVSLQTPPVFTSRVRAEDRQVIGGWDGRRSSARTISDHSSEREPQAVL